MFPSIFLLVALLFACSCSARVVSTANNEVPAKLAFGTRFSELDGVRLVDIDRARAAHLRNQATDKQTRQASFGVTNTAVCLSTP